MKSLVIALLVSVCSLSAAAQSPSAVLKQAEKALGGKAFKNVTSVRSTGTIKRLSDGATGKYVARSARPNLLNVRFDIAGFETETGYNGRSAWRRDSRDGVVTLTGRDSVTAQAEAVFRNSLWFAAKNEKAKITTGGTATVDGKPANAVVYTTQKGVAIKLYFDQATGLLIREEIPRGEKIEVQIGRAHV